MSWFAAVDAKPLSEIEQAIEAAQLDGAMVSAEHEQQLAAAKVAAISLIQSGAVGHPAQVSAHLSGHSNPDHGPRAGWADPQVTVTVRAVFDAPKATAEA